ncbi:MAG TPA: GlsB/YeaQ/YmgE family stress response membrane protein [Vicinamibacterales bacterium]|nr:GlsB/YeaQ/YmgE family stress response membrane protein [Vicinamibacterales bacterium]
MIGVLGWIVFGFIVGAVAKLLTPGRDPGGFLITILIGIAGSLLGGYLGRAMGWYGPNQSAGLLMSIVGAVILLAIFHLLFARRVVWRSRLTNRP